MDWIQVTVLTSTQGSELVSEQLIEAGSAGTMIEDINDVTEYENSRPEGRWDILDDVVRDNMPKDVQVSGYYAADFRAGDIMADVKSRMEQLARRSGPIDLGKLELRQTMLDDEDWAENWKKQFIPFRLGEKLVVKPGWCDYEAKPGDKIIEIDPGMAFGTGTHETTALCSVLLERYLKPGDTVIDVGTGTGILAIAASLCGASDVLATDIDPVAVRVATENVAINHLQDKIRTRQGDLLEAVNEVADIVVANIIADVICYLAKPVRAHIKDGGMFICSGIAREKKDVVLEALNAAGYCNLDIHNKGEWTAIACYK